MFALFDGFKIRFVLNIIMLFVYKQVLGQAYQVLCKHDHQQIGGKLQIWLLFLYRLFWYLWVCPFFPLSGIVYAYSFY